VLATLMRRFEVLPVPGHTVEPIQRITLRPNKGMPLILQKRRSAD
jgi:cytochrome P450